jgi:hypothetical protein
MRLAPGAAETKVRLVKAQSGTARARNRRQASGHAGKPDVYLCARGIARQAGWPAILVG